MSNKLTIGIVAHVDAGKTTLAESILYNTGVIRKKGRVDTGDTALDTNSIEKERGITIFNGSAECNYNDFRFTLIDTPGHVDFSCETERVMSVMDYAILVISASDVIQSHTITLWELLKHYNIPTFIFVTKSDLGRHNEEDVINRLSKKFGTVVKYSPENAFSDSFETISLSSEEALDEYLNTDNINNDTITSLIHSRKLFPCLFGSGLQNQGVTDLLELMKSYTEKAVYSDNFSAKVYKITYDKNLRMTHVKITGGSINVRDTLKYNNKEEKITAIRIYNGEKYTATESAKAGDICAICGLSETFSGQLLGENSVSEPPVLTPIMSYKIALPDDCDPKLFYPKLKLLCEEDPQLNITWHERINELHVELMGEIQAQILKSVIFDRFGVEVSIENGEVLYKETITDTVEGVGHYEPLRHYAEVHLIMSPLPRGSGLIFESKCKTNDLDLNWQRLILTHLYEKTHVGVLCGFPITDMKISLSAGRAHIKHTEGGDFREATYRAVRQGLMRAKSVLLEPYYSFSIELPSNEVSRCINDIKMMKGSYDTPEYEGEKTTIRGKAPVTEMNGYAQTLASYTQGQGKMYLNVAGYDVCHNEDEIKEKMAYNPESDLENTPDSVFCAHGGGFAVKWNKVEEYMNIESTLSKEENKSKHKKHKNITIDEKELEEIMTREFGPIKRPSYSLPKVYQEPTKKNQSKVAGIPTDYLIIDGYNVIHSMSDLKETAEINLDDAREELINILINYSAFVGCKTILVFDAYNVKNPKDTKEERDGLLIVYTKEDETADAYIEKLLHDIGKNDKVRVVTSDGLIRISALASGILRMTSEEFENEISDTDMKIKEIIEKHTEQMK